jgi:PBP1b-binding outer membrane lipoprotein LpoB
MRRAVALALLLTGCSGQFAFGPPAFQQPPPTQPTGPQRLIVENGQVIQEPLTPIESTIEGLSQAQTVRTLVKQLSRNR